MFFCSILTGFLVLEQVHPHFLFGPVSKVHHIQNSVQVMLPGPSSHKREILDNLEWKFRLMSPPQPFIVTRKSNPIMPLSLLALLKESCMVLLIFVETVENWKPLNCYYKCTNTRRILHTYSSTVEILENSIWSCQALFSEVINISPKKCWAAVSHEYGFLATY